MSSGLGNQEIMCPGSFFPFPQHIPSTEPDLNGEGIPQWSQLAKIILKFLISPASLSETEAPSPVAYILKSSF